MSSSGKDMFLSPEVRVVEASAGSGKTYALAKRYVQLALHLTRERHVVPIHSILAITFTNKAAFEMKERILKFLKELALGVMPEKDRVQILAPLGISDDEAKALAQKIMETILRHYNYFQVQTIDKFINGLLVSSAFQIGLTANFRIKTSAREYLARCLDALVEEAGTNAAVKAAFDDFLTSMLLVESRSNWLPKDVVLDTVQQLFNEYNTYGLDFLRGGKTPQDLIQAKASVLNDMKVFAQQMPEGVHATFLESVNRFVEHYQSAFSFKALSASFQPGKPVRMKKGALLTPWHEDQWSKVQEGFVRAARLEVEHLYDPYIELFERVRQGLDAACVRDDIVFLGQLNARARAVYAQGLGVDELYYRLATRFEHYLFDEFQDTSLLQWQNISPLPEDALAKGGSLYYVGDKKQAIYSFRGGDTRLFDAIAAQYQDPGYHCRKDTLDTSYRSHEAIVQFNNEIFGLGNLERLMRAVNDKGERIIPARASDFEELHRVYSMAHQKWMLKDPLGCVRIEVLQGGKKDDYNEVARVKVLARLHELKARFKWSDIAFLVRKNHDVELVTRWLLEAGIPASSERTLNIKEHLLIREIVAFLRFLASPVDNAAFGEFILGDIFTAACAVERARLQDFILDWHIQRHHSLYGAFLEKFPGLWQQHIEGPFKNAGLYPLYELIVSFYRETKVLERFPYAQGFLMRFLGLVQSRENEFPSMADFLAHYDDLEGDELFVEVPGDEKAGDAVRVMTVHKAKGLEFPVVILPFISMGLRAGACAGNKALAYTLRVEDEGLRLYHFTSAHTPYSQCAMDLSVDEDMAAFFAELNNLYVALTRAACEMYGFIPLRVKNAHNLALDLVPTAFYNVGAPGQGYPRKARDVDGVPKELDSCACRDWIGFLNDEFTSKQEWAMRRERREGDLYHAALAGTMEGVADAYKETLEDFLAARDVRPFFTASGANVFVEKEFVDAKGTSRRMDRVLVFDREVWVVDYKLTLSGEQEGRCQVQEYMAILADVYPGRMIKGWLAFIKEQKVLQI